MDENAVGQVITEPAVLTTPEASPPVTLAEANTERPSENVLSEMEKRFADGFLNAGNLTEPQAAAKPAQAQQAEATTAAAEEQADAPGETEQDQGPVQETEQPADNTATAPVSPRTRDWVAEWKELADAHPEVVGKPMPDDIYKACLTSEHTPLRIYESMMLTKLSSEIDALKAENATLRQNAEASARAPVTPDMGGANLAAEDAFLRGFNLQYRR